MMDTADETKPLAESARSTGGAKGDDDRTVLNLKKPVVVFPPPPDGARPLYEHLSKWLVRSRALSRAYLSKHKPCERMRSSLIFRLPRNCVISQQLDQMLKWHTPLRTVGEGGATHQAVQNG